MGGEAGAAADLGRERGEHERVARARLEHAVEPQSGHAGAVGVEARIGVQQRCEARGGGAEVAAGEAEEGERELVQPGVRGGGVDVAELGGEGEQQVGERRASAGRQASEAIHSD